MKTNLLKISNRLLSALISLLGVGSLVSLNGCKQNNCEYGTPNAKFKVNEKVMTETGQPIQNIEAEFDRNPAFTDKEDNYEVETTSMLTSSLDLNMHFTDIDGENNGLYHDFETTVFLMKKSSKGGDGRLYAGEVGTELNIKSNKHE